MVAGSATPPTIERQHTYPDWVVESARKSLCKGHYSPLMPLHSEIQDFSSYPLILSANESTLTFEGQSVLRGNVSLKQGDRLLAADEVVIERSRHTRDFERLLATGHIGYFAPGLTLWGEQAEYFHEKGELFVSEASYRCYDKHARGKAQRIEIEKDASAYLTNATYTTCSPFDNTWLLSARQIKLSPQHGRASAKHIQLDVLDIPVFYVPYFNYPIDNKRHSGFLFPSYGQTSNSGSEIVIPYYWNIAPNYDFNFAGRWLSERGTEGQSKFNYLFAHSEGTIQWHYLPNDRKYGGFSKENRLSPPGDLSEQDPRIRALNGSSDRTAFNYRHTTRWSHKWQANILIDYVSDDNYFVDLGNDINTASTVHLPQQANLSYFGDNWTHYFNIEEYQVLQPLSKPINDEIYKRQPQWVFQTLYPQQWLNLTFGLNGETVNFTHKRDLLSQLPVTTGQRLHLRPSVSLPWHQSWYYIIPKVQVDWLYYTLKLSENDEIQSLPRRSNRTIPIYDLDAGVFFERDAHFKHYQFIQTIEPRIYYLYVPYRDQHLYPSFDSGVINFSYAQLFRDNRFSGRDRIGDTNQVSISLTSRLLPSKGGQEWLRASIGQIFYFQERKVFLCEQFDLQNVCIISEDPNADSNHSNLIAQAEFHPNSVWTGGFFWEWDSIHQKTEQASVNLQFHPSQQKIINLNYYWQAHDIAQINPTTGDAGSLHQADLSLFWPLHLHWQLLTRWHYDLMQRQTVEILAGLEYNACCFALQLVGSRYRQSSNFFYPQPFATGIFAQVVFKGLSAIGLNNPDNKLKQKIPGYLSLYDRQDWLTHPNTFPQR